MRRSTRGFTLTELLIVVCVVALLAGLLFPVLARSMRRAKLGAEVEQLRQLGVAAGLYAEEHGTAPLWVGDFRGTALWGSPLWAGDCDPFRAGYRNEVLKSLYDPRRKKLTERVLDRIVPFKVSYVGFDDFVNYPPENAKRVLAQPNAGWLVSFDEQDIGVASEYGRVIVGSYTRLNFDGSVVHRNGQLFAGQLNPMWLFADFSDAEKRIDAVPTGG